VLFGYTLCLDCRANLKLFTDKTIERHALQFKEAKRQDPEHLTYEEEMRYRLDFIHKDYISKRIKLLHILSKLSADGLP